MKHIKILLTLFLFFGFTLTNCTGDDCNCPPFEGSYFDIRGIESIQHHERVSDNAAPPVADGEQISFSNYYGFIMKYSLSYLNMNHEGKSNSGDMGQLYACSCFYSGEQGSKNEKIKDITVITLNDFSVSFKANDTINDIISVHGQPWNEFIDQNTALLSTPNMAFSLSEPPSLNDHFKVKIILELSTGEIYEKESATVVLE